MLNRLIAIAIVSSLPALAVAKNGNRSAPETFNGGFDGTIASLVFEGTTAHVDLQATGSANVIGDFSLSFVHTVDLVTGIESGTMYLMADSDGDTLEIYVHGPSGPDPDFPFIVHASPLGAIMGGTGKYRHATGAVHFEALINLATLEVSGSWTGFIANVKTRGRHAH